MARTTSDIIVESLLDWGVDTIFGLPGDGINGFVEALRKAKDRIRLIHLRHEETAAMAACGYAKFTGKIGVCFSTAGPGAVHLLNGLYDAKIDQAPVLAITGMPYHDLIGTDYLQDMNQDYLFQDVAAYNQRIMGPAHAANVVDLACRTALAHRAVAHLCIPIDTQVSKARSERRSKRNIPGHTSAVYTTSRRIPEIDVLKRAGQLLSGKERIVILAGAGARGARTELLQVAERLSAPIVKAQLGKEVIPDDNPYAIGGTGVVGTRPASAALKNCDAILIIGSSFPYIEFYPHPGQATGIQIDDRPERIGLRYPVDIGLVGDAASTLRALLEHLPHNGNRSFLTEMQAQMREWWALMEERGTAEKVPMQPQVVTWNLSQLLDDDAIICGDSGTIVTWLGRMMLRADQRFSFSGTHCSMAAALPYAIGAQVAYPGRQVVALTGDGALSMMMGDLVTLCQHQLPVKLIVLKNNTLGLIKWEQMVYLGNPEYGVDLAPIDFVKVAEACGARGIRIEDPQNCRNELAAALGTDGPVVVEAVVDANVPPLPPEITRDQAQNFAESLAKGEVNRKPISLTIGREMMAESDFAASPFGIPGRVRRRLGRKIKEKLGRDGGDE